MIEKLIEHWLTNVNELGYQLPFCEVLLTKGYHVLHVSSHGPGEHGKDIIARDSQGGLWAFQLKGGDIRLSDWRTIRSEVEELVRLPVSFPGVNSGEKHTPVLVTNGAIAGDARDSINQFARQWEADGARQLLVWPGKDLLARFLEAHGSFLPVQLSDVRTFVELYVENFADRLPRSKFSRFLEKLVRNASAKTAIKKKRLIESIILIGAYIAQQYESAGNHVSAAEGWTIVTAQIFYIVQQSNLAEKYFAESLGITWEALERNLARFVEEVLGRGNFLEEPDRLVEPVVYGSRVTITLGWLAAAVLSRRYKTEITLDRTALWQMTRREMKRLRVLTEADWPAFMALALLLEREGAWRDADHMLGIWSDAMIRTNKGPNATGMPSPYWLQEKVLAKKMGMLAPDEDEQFGGRSYSLASALDMLVRRLCRQRVAALWRPASHVNNCGFVPGRQEEWFLWVCEDGELREEVPPPTISWRSWRESTSMLSPDRVPSLLIRYPEWILPFALTFPHRCNRDLSALADAKIGRRGALATQ